MRRSVLVAFAVLGACVGCGDTASGPAPTPGAPSGAAWSEVAEGALTVAQRGQKAKADGAREALFGRLMARLTEEMAKNGPTAAVAVCREQAHPIAAAVAKEQGVAIGRTSHKLRNPMNAPPAWAAGFVAAARATPAFVAAPDGRLGVLTPIRLKANCLACHGDANALDPAVAAEIARGYPRDQATGFQEGDLRGWFWVEVPTP